MTSTIDSETPGAGGEQPPSPPGEKGLGTENGKAFRRAELSDKWVRVVLTVLAVIPALALAFLAYQLFKTAWPAFGSNGIHFFYGNSWQQARGVANGGYGALPGMGSVNTKAHYGIGPMILGTLVSSIIALVIAIPVAVTGTILLVERLPQRLQDPLSVFLQLLAGIPSVIFGLWGIFILGPPLAQHVYPLIADLGIPWLSEKGTITHNGQGILTASVVLAVMIIPIIASTTRELLRAVPATAREGAVALGLTPSESVRAVTLPFVRSGVIAASFLGWGRALGETMAVLMISGGSPTGVYPRSVFAPFMSLASTIAQQLEAALQGGSNIGSNPLLQTIAEIGLVLLVITLVTNFAGRIISSRLSGGTSLPVGRGV